MDEAEPELGGLRRRFVKHARLLASLIVLVVLAVAGCGAAGSTSVTTIRYLPKAAPGQAVPRSAVRRLTAIADRAVTLDGGHPVAWAMAVVTTLAKAAAPNTIPGGNAVVVYLVTAKGRFLCGACTGPPGSRTPTGSYISLIIEAKNFDETGFGISPKAPPSSAARLGPVTYLKVHPTAQGTVKGSFLMVGGPAAVRLPLPGQVIATNAAGQRFTVSSGKNGLFTMLLPPGTYHLTGYSRRVQSNGQEMRCIAEHAVQVTAGKSIRGIAVICSVR